MAKPPLIGDQTMRPQNQRTPHQSLRPLLALSSLVTAFFHACLSLGYQWLAETGSLCHS